jgi:hypothetical protein
MIRKRRENKARKNVHNQKVGFWIFEPPTKKEFGGLSQI